MAILVVAQAPDMTAAEDAALVTALNLESSPPAGCWIRMAGPTVDGWRMVSLWDSDADYERFRDQRLVPALTGLGRVLTTIQMWPIQTVRMLRMP
ncbi:MAG: hypothetical protein JO037_17635 [Actinobacteria bacterium]|nr:hypothetical protein [Actinomycetota bacterium]